MGSILDWEDPLEEGMATHSSIVARRIPWTEELGYSPWDCHKESDMTEQLAHTQQMFLYPLVIKDESLLTSTFVCSSLASSRSLHSNYLVMCIPEFILYILATEI